MEQQFEIHKALLRMADGTYEFGLIQRDESGFILDTKTGVEEVLIELKEHVMMPGDYHVGEFQLNNAIVLTKDSRIVEGRVELKNKPHGQAPRFFADSKESLSRTDRRNPLFVLWQKSND